LVVAVVENSDYSGEERGEVNDNNNSHDHNHLNPADIFLPSAPPQTRHEQQQQLLLPQDQLLQPKAFDSHSIDSLPLCNIRSSEVTAAALPTDIFIPMVVVATAAVAGGANAQHTSVPNLIRRLSESLDPAIEIIQWCQQNNSDDFTPDDLGQLFTFLGSSLMSQIAFADQLVARLSQISCAHIAAVLNKCSSILKTDLARRLSVICFDKFQNKALIRAQLSPFEWTRVEGYYA
jgi:hypothetical protein